MGVEKPCAVFFMARSSHTCIKLKVKAWRDTFKTYYKFRAFTSIKCFGQLSFLPRAVWKRGTKGAEVGLDTANVELVRTGLYQKIQT
jgi:hypothetical protein